MEGTQTTLLMLLSPHFQVWFSGYSEDGIINNETIADIWLGVMKKNLVIRSSLRIGSVVTRNRAVKHPEALMGINLTHAGIIRELVLHDQSPEFSSEEREY